MSPAGHGGPTGGADQEETAVTLPQIVTGTSGPPTVDGAGFTVRRPSAEDLPTLVALLADDELGRTREDADLAATRPRSGGSLVP
jgi:hypothetical protein